MGEFSRYAKDAAPCRSCTVTHGNTVYVFNVGGNLYRVVAAVHFNTQRVYVLRVMTHREYDSSDWKEAL